MRLTSYSNYSMRVLMVAAARHPQLTTIQEVAEGFGISRAHLVKCVHQLGARGLLTTVRGHKGGFRLARPAAEIGVGDVIRGTEDGFDLVECFDPASNTCPLAGACRLRGVLERARAAFLAELDAVTLADIVGSGDVLLALIDRYGAPACDGPERALQPA
jgi:Rrf2 family nitric oxide-sensitive transcriptional repressor